VSSNNTDVVQEIYAAFGRGDIPSVLERLTPDIEFVLPESKVIPFAGTHRGLDAIGKFFMTIGETVDIEEFTVDKLIAQGETVVALGHERVKAKSTSRGWETKWAMVWTVRDGKVQRLEEHHHTEQMAAAFRS
jgi:ketosteroid isomerase-like protein